MKELHTLQVYNLPTRAHASVYWAIYKQILYMLEHASTRIYSALTSFRDTNIFA